MINSRFLNYKHYNSFIRDLNDNLISKDAIVFIQDESHTCIWTHDKEYLCNVSKSNLEEGTLVFGDGYGSNVFTIKIDGETITLTDSDGDSYSASYVLKSLVDTKLSPTSTNPVQNKSVYNALIDKANKDDVLYPEDIIGKQDKLIAGRGIDIQNNVVSSTLDTEVYVILTQDEFPPINPSENKIYLLLSNNGDDEFVFTQYTYKNGQWGSISQIAPTIDIVGYLKKQDADEYYQPKGQYTKISDVQNYCNTNVIPLFNDYYTKEWIQTYYQTKPKSSSFATKAWCKKMFVLQDTSEPVPDDEEEQQTPVIPDNPQPHDVGDGYTHVFLEQQEYDNIQSYDSNTIYFIYEESEESGIWKFGNKFPIILTDGATNGIGLFPINLT